MTSMLERIADTLNVITNKLEWIGKMLEGTEPQLTQMPNPDCAPPTGVQFHNIPPTASAPPKSGYRTVESKICPRHVPINEPLTECPLCLAQAKRDMEFLCYWLHVQTPTGPYGIRTFTFDQDSEIADIVKRYKPRRKP